MNTFKNNYRILKEHSLVTIVHNGYLNLNSMMSLMKKLCSDPIFSSNFDCIIDINDVVIDLTIKDINIYVNHLENNSNPLENKRIALITNTPKQVVYSTLFKQEQELLHPLQKVQIFSTLENACEFLKLKDCSVDLVLENIKTLKKEFLS